MGLKDFRQVGGPRARLAKQGASFFCFPTNEVVVAGLGAGLTGLKMEFLCAEVQLNEDSSDCGGHKGGEGAAYHCPQAQAGEVFSAGGDEGAVPTDLDGD